jgi:hypothetical protein
MGPLIVACSVFVDWREAGSVRGVWSVSLLDPVGLRDGGSDATPRLASSVRWV